MAERAYSHHRPIDADFYRAIRIALGDKKLTGVRHDLTGDRGMIVKAPAGSLISFEPSGPQIVNVFFWNTGDPDERYWAEETMLIEGAYLQRNTRLWGTMARFRPLATVIEDSVVTLRPLGQGQAFHHFAHGGSGTPADWIARGGKPGVVTSWERLVDAMQTEGLPAHAFMENVSLFQKTAIEPTSQVLTVLPSDALEGDRMIWFAEIDLTLAVAASPYRGGGVPPAQLDGKTRPVTIRVQENVAKPLGWPYPGVPYPDLSLYLDPKIGTRTTVIGPTPGIGGRR